MAQTEEPLVDIASRLERIGLPLFPSLPPIAQALEKGLPVIVRSDPGSGKSTLVPLYLMERKPGRILMLEPRRVAAQGIAVRMADILGEPVGRRVGYSVRMERKVSEYTRIEVVTEGLLVRRIQGDPDLSGVSTIIFDEFHERSIHTDLALALTLELRKLRDDLSLAVMSATMDSQRVADFLDAAESRSGDRRTVVVESPGRMFPVDIEHRPLPGRDRLGRECARVVADEAIRSASAIGTMWSADEGGAGAAGAETAEGGDILVFLPGRGEIEDAAAALGQSLPPGIGSVLKLHGGLPLSEQKKVLAPKSGTDRVYADGVRTNGVRTYGIRIILSTNVAETGLTVRGVTTVVDSGLVRLQRFHLGTGMDRLTLENASAASVEQRAGRAGRLSRGRCIRLWDSREQRPADTSPEIARVDLSPLVLECALWGCRSPEDLSWLDTPKDAPWQNAADLLIELGALDASFNPTELGRTMARLGLHPRLAALALHGQREGHASLACAAAAVLADRDGSAIRNDADLRLRLEALRGNNPEGESWRRRTMELARDVSARIGTASSRAGWTSAEETDLGDLLCAAFPDRLGRRQSPGVYRFPSGREAALDGPLGSEEWIVAPEVDAGERLGKIRLAAPVSAATALRLLEKDIREERRIEWEGLVPRTLASRRVGRLELSAARSKSLRAEAAADLPRLLSEQGLGLLPWDEQEGAPRRYLERLRFYISKGNPHGERVSWSDADLAMEAGEWLGPYIWNGQESAGGPILTGAQLSEALRSRLGWKNADALEKTVPDRFETPAGSLRKLDYSSGEPVLRVRIQEVFGMSANPRILGVPVVFCLLSPASRPLQTTGDLVGFWTGSYAEVRKDMRGRYPRHYWPEDPRQAEATTRAKPRST